MTWHSNQWGPGQSQRRPKRANPSQEKDKVEKPADKFPAYDRHQPAAAGPGSSSSTSALPQEVIALLQNVVEQNPKTAEVLEGLIPDPTSTELKTKQRQLNMVRKLMQKIERKEAALVKKENMMNQFLEEMRQHIISEKCRHKSEMDSIKQEIDEAKVALQKVKNGQIDDMETNKTEEDLDALLNLDQAPAELVKENAELKNEIQRMNREHHLQQKQMYDMQNRMEEFMKTFADSHAGTTKHQPIVAGTPAEIFAGLPSTIEKVNLEEMDSEIAHPKTPQRTHPALVPFRGGRNSNRSSPYNKEAES